MRLCFNFFLHFCYMNIKIYFFMSSFFQVICFILAISFLMHTMDSNVNIYCSLSLYFIKVVFLYNESIIFELGCFKTIILKQIVSIFVPKHSNLSMLKEATGQIYFLKETTLTDFRIPLS